MAVAWRGRPTTLALLSRAMNAHKQATVTAVDLLRAASRLLLATMAASVKFAFKHFFLCAVVTVASFTA